MKTHLGAINLSLLLHLAFTAQCVLTVDLENPGIRLVVTKKGLDYVNDIGLEIITELIQTQLEGREIRGNTKIKVSSGLKIQVHYDIQNITLEKLEVQESSILSDPITGLNLQLTNVDLNISADISLSFGGASFGGASFGGASFGGGLISVSLKIGTIGLDLHLGVRINRTDSGQPSFSVTACSFKPGLYDIHFSGDGSSFLNGDSVMGTIKKYIDDGEKLCDLARSQVEQALKDLLPDPPVAQIEDYAGISYALFKDPVFTSDHIVAELEGDFRTVTIPNMKPPFTRTPLPPFNAGDCADKMACMWVTEYVANSASVVLKRAGALVFNITEDIVEDDDDLKKKIKKSFFKLDTGTFSLIVPQLFHRYPDKPLTLTVRAVKDVPYVKITETYATLNIPAAIDVYVNDSANNIFPVAFTMRVATSIKAYVGVANVTHNKTTFTITANATEVKMSVSRNGSNIGFIDYIKINKLITVFKLIKEHLIPSLNKQTKHGYGIKLIPNLTFVEPNLTYFKGGLLLGTDFNYEIT